MGKLMRAFRAEQRKLWSKGSLLGCFVLMFVLSFAMSFFCSVIKGSGVDAGELIGVAHAENAFAQPMNEGWRDKTAALIEEREDQIKETAVLISEAEGVEKAVLEHEMAQLVRDKSVAQYRLDNNLTVWDWSGSYSLILCLWLMTPVAAAVAVIYSSDIFAGEFARGTIRAVISRPVTRFKLYIAKMITSLMLGVLLMAVAYAAAGIGCGVLMNESSGVYVGVLNGNVYSAAWSTHVFMVFLCCCASVAVSVALCAAVGNLTRSRGISAACAVLLVPVSILAGPMAQFADSGIIGVLLPFCCDLTVPLCDVPCSSGVNFAACAVSVGVHFLLFSYAGYAGFRRDI